MMRDLFRIEPKMPVTGVQTYAISQPAATHTRAATCEEVQCEAYRNGWTTTVDVSTELGKRQAYYIRIQSGRRWTASQGEGRGLRIFHFSPGQRCFREHRVSLERKPLYLKFGGDWRAHTTETQTMREADWVDDFANHQDHIQTIKDRG